MARLTRDNHMSFQITETGLAVKGGLSEAEHDEIASLLIRAEKGLQWAWGDWYNTIPKGDKQAYCEKLGVKFNTAMIYGAVAAKFPPLTRVKALTFRHYRILALEKLSDDQRETLIRKAIEGDIDKNVPWSAARLKKEREKLLGRLPEVEGPPLDNHLDAILEELPKSASKKVKRGIEEEFKHLQASFNKEVEKRVSARMKEERRQLKELRAQLEDDRKRIRNASMKIDGLLTKTEYRKILGVIHPDKQPDERQKNEAFKIFNKLAESVNPSASRWNQ